LKPVLLEDREVKRQKARNLLQLAGANSMSVVAKRAIGPIILEY
jgi:hypothetical protein